MTTSRRKFLKWSALTSLFAGLTLRTGIFSLAQEGPPQKDSRGLFIVPEEAKRENLFHFSKSSFEPYLKSEFRVQLGRTTTTLTLVQIADCDSPNRLRRGECFVLIFKSDKKLPEGITTANLEHDALGTFPLFLGNWKNWNDPNGIYYQATINRTEPAVAM